MTKTFYNKFDSTTALKEIARSHYPMDELVIQKRIINWAPGVRKCLECKSSFNPEHPAQHFCGDCQNKDHKTHRRQAVIKTMKSNPKITQCETCNKDFYKTAPAMRKCCNCSKKGGELVK